MSSDQALKALQACELPSSWVSNADSNNEHDAQNIFENCHSQTDLADRKVDAANTIWKHLDKAHNLTLALGRSRKYNLGTISQTPEFKLNIEHYNAFIKIIFDHGDGSFDSKKIHSDLRYLNIQPDEETYRLIIQKYQKVS